MSGQWNVAALLPALLAVLLTLATATAKAGARDSGWLVRTWQTDDGLPDNRIYAVVQSPDGFLWVATRGGLVRFDGLRFEELMPEVSAGVAKREVTAVHFDRRGRAWLGYKHGEVVCLEGGTLRHYGAKEKLPDRQVNGFAEDAAGTLVAEYSSGSALLRIEQGKAELMPGTGRGGGQWQIAGARGGDVWVAIGESVGVLRDGQIQEQARVRGPVLDIAAARAGGIWIATAQQLLRLEEGRPPEEKAQLPGEVAGSAVSVLLEDRGGAVWIGTLGSGLLRFDGQQCEKVETVDRGIRCLAEDKEGNIWVGTSGGLNQLRPRSIGLLASSDGVSFESALSVAEQAGKGEDATGRLWVVTEDGKVVRQEGASWVMVSSQAYWPGETATCVAGDAQGGMWIGTTGPRLHRFEDGKFRSWSASDGLAGDGVRTLFISSDGDVWVGVTGPDGLQRLHDGTLQTYPMPEAKLPERIRAIAEVKGGEIWVGTSGGQLLSVEGGRVVNGAGGASGLFGSIHCLEATADGSLWVGCGGSGLARLKEGQVARITTAAGLGEDYISQMLVDGRGRFWCVGARGLFQMRLEELTAVADGKAKWLRTVVYGRGEGVKSLEAGGRVVTGALRRRSGELYFPTRSGLVVVDPKPIRHSAAPPRVLLENVTVDGQPVGFYDARSPLGILSQTNLVDLRPAGAFVGLRPNYHKLQISFCAPHFTSPENVQFRYQLEGFDEGWVEAGAQRSVSYPNLPAGDYRFHVTACNELGMWNEEATTLKLRVTPFFWQTGWFRWGLLGVFTLVVVGVVRYVSYRRLRERVREVERQSALDRERARIARDMHDTLGASLTQINFLGEAASREAMPAEQVREHVGKITRSSHALVQQLDEIVWAVDPENDTLDGLATYISQFATEFFGDGPIRCRVRAPALLPELRLTTEVRHNLFLAVREALNNVARHSEAKEATINLNVEGDGVIISVEDNGRGFDVAAAAGRHGQANLKQRLEEIGGVCRVESQPGSGTKITLIWPRRDE